MSDLQITLVALGAIIILCVLLYNWWQERKFRHSLTSSFKELKRDVLIDDFEINTENIKINADVFEKHQAKQPVKSREEMDRAALEQVALAPTTQPEAPLEEPLLESIDTEPLTSEQATIEASAYVDNNDGEVEVVTDLDEASASEAEQVLVLAEPLVEPNVEPLVEPSAEYIAAPQALASTEPQLETPLAEFTAPAFINLSINLPSMIDQKIDLVALINLEQGLSEGLDEGLSGNLSQTPAQDKFNYALNELLEALDELDKPAHVFGLDTDGVWHLIANDRHLTQAYSQLSLSLQLADRGGAVSKANLNRFQHAVETLGATLDCAVEWLSDSGLEFAQQLDQFCIAVDKIIGLHVVQGESGAFHGTKLKGLAEANGFSLGKDGAFHYLNTQANAESVPLFTIIHQNNQLFTSDNLRSIVIKGITFQMDIPRVEHCAEAFKQMVAIAQKMQISLGAYLVDDNQKPLAALQIDKIYQQLEGIQAAMLKHGIASGSPTALRLFV